MKPLLLLFLLIALPIFAQSPVEPARVQIVNSNEDQDSCDLADNVRSELRKLRYVVITQDRPDWRMVFTTKKDACGYIAALVVIDRRGNEQLSLHTGDTVQSLARHLIEKMEREFFKNRE